MKLGQRIRRARQRMRMTQARLSTAIGCTEGYVAHIEHSRSLPSELKLLKICEVLGLEKRDMIRQRQREKAGAEARPFYEEPVTERVYMRDGHRLTDEQVAFALRVIEAVEKNDKVRAAIDLIIGED